jgi:nucleotide-binding universal stress UspA family protein
MTIVCATHLSNSSFAAVKAAAALAHVKHESLDLISVVPPRPLATTDDHPVSEALRLEARALNADGIETTAEVLHGTLEGAVRKFCEDRHASLLVVGDSTHAIASLAAGPMHAFKDGVDVPLLVVRDARPFERWARGEAALKVMLALDHTWSSAIARDWITRLASYGAIDLVAAFVWWPADEDARRGTAPSPESDGHRTMTEVIARELEAALASLPANVKHRVRLELGADHIAAKLLVMAGDEQVDLLVLGSHTLQGPLARLRSVSNGVLADAPMSVACIPSRDAAPSPATFTTAPLVADAVR